MVEDIYDNTDKFFYERVWDILVEHAGASRSEDDKISFVLAYTRVNDPIHEYRCCWALGFGGKFWRLDYSNEFFIRGYPEDETPKTKEICNRVNDLIRQLVLDLKPKRMPGDF